MLEALVFRATPRAVCALPLAHVRETMRPLGFEPMKGLPDAIAGVSVVRGRPTPVVDVRTLLGERRPPGERAGRWVSLAVGERDVVLAVDAVLGVRRLPNAPEKATPLAAASPATAALGVHDGELLVVLRAARLIDDATWQALEKALGATNGA